MGGVVEGVGVVTREYFDGNGNITSLLSRAYQYIKANLPSVWPLSEAEKKARDQSFAQFATFLSKPSAKEVYQSELQALDITGIIDLGRIDRDDWPRKEVNYLALICMNTYENENYFLGSSVIQDSCNIAKEFRERGYRVTYLCNPTAREFYKWVDFFSGKVKQEVFVYFAGVSTCIIDPLASPKGDITQVLVFRDESKNADGTGGKGKVRPTAELGLSSCTLSENYIIDLIERAAAITRRTVFVANCLNNPDLFSNDREKVSLARSQVPQSACGNKVPPFKTVYIQYNSSEVSKMHNFSKDFCDLLSSNDDDNNNNNNQTTAIAAATTTKTETATVAPTKTTTFITLKGKYVNDYQRRSIKANGGLTIYSYPDAFYSKVKLMEEPIVATIVDGKGEMQLPEVLQILDVRPEDIVSLPDTNILSPAEIEGANKRWAQFTAEMKKSPSYDTQYKKYLKELDAMGCINLARLNRDQIPDVRIDRACALFFCPYEGLSCSLGVGPINDAITMATLYIAKGYKILYCMDATPKEYYSWMDWILTNIHYEIVSYFSGHGTQVKDVTGLEEDGLSELMVFFNENKKKANIKALKPVVGVGEQTVSDYCMHELIVLKDYPETRIVLISDCCHSGTMFNFDQQIPAENGRPPLNIVCIGAASDTETAKQTTFNGKESGVFTHALETVINRNGQATFRDLENYTKAEIANYQTINITTTNRKLLNMPVIAAAKYGITDSKRTPSSSSSSSSKQPSHSSFSSMPSSEYEHTNTKK